MKTIRAIKSLGLFFVIACLLFFMPVNVFASVSGNGISEYPVANKLDLFSLDVEKTDDETLNHYINMNDWYKIGLWLSSFSEEEYQKLLKRDTVLLHETCVAESTEKEPETMLYYEYAMKVYEQNKGEVRATPTQTSGYWTTKFVKLNALGVPVKTAVMTHKITNIDTTIPTTEQQKVTITKSISDNWLNVDWQDTTQTFKTYTAEVTNTTYPLVRSYFNWFKPAGYKVSTSYSLNNSFHQIYWSPTDTFGVSEGFFVSGGVLNPALERKAYPDNCTFNGISTEVKLRSESNAWHGVVAIVNLFANAGVGTTATPANGNLVQTVTFTPSTYNVNYKGNGATGGSVAAQSCVYDQTYTMQQNGYARRYTVTYNGNGGTPSVASQTADYTFKGWGLNQASAVNYNAGASYKNLTPIKDSAVNMYAIWNPASVKLPTASRTGYTFSKWNIGAAGGTYTPTANVTATAQWTANSYKIAFNSNGGSLCSTLSATYDTNISLPTPARAGYTFTGWTGAGGTYKGVVKNLTAVNGATVTLTAQWSANTNTPYKIVRMWEQNEGMSDWGNKPAYPHESSYEATEIAYGTTDSVVTVPAGAVEGYETPDVQTVKINGNGTTTVTFYYTLIPVPKDYAYRVNHYIKTSPEGEYELFVSDEQKVKEDSVVTPPLNQKAIDAVNEIKGCYCKEPSVQTVTISKDGMTIDYYYDCVNIEVEYTVEHYIKTNPDGQYALYKTNRLTAKEGAVVTPVLDEDAIGKVNSVKGCLCKEPDLQTVTAEENLVVKYYYDCIKNTEQSGPVVNKTDTTTTVTGGVTQTQIDEITKRIAAGLSFSLKVDGAKYDVVQNPDGTLGIKFIAAKNEKNITIPDVVTIGKKIYRITEVRDSAFKNNTAIEKVTLSANISKIGDSAFEGCSRLKTITVNSGVASVGKNAFKNCTSLTKFKAPSTLHSIGNYAFAGCVKLKTLKLNQGLVKIGKKAFYKCQSLKKITVPATVLRIGSYGFAKCPKLKTVKFASDAGVLAIGEGAFSETAIVKITLPDKLSKITKKTFYKCKKLNSVKIGASAAYIGSNAFHGCSKLTTVSGGEKVSVIYQKAFCDCTALKKITLESKIQTIGKQAFYNCKKLKTVTIRSKAITSVGSKAFKKCKKNIVFKVPKGKVNAYKKLFKGKY